MAVVVEELDIAAPREAVWAALADFGGIVRWAPNVDHSCLTTTQSDGVGAVRRVQVGRNVLLERVVEWDPGQRLSYALEGLPRVFRLVTNTWQLQANGDSTTVSLTTSIDSGPRPPQQIVSHVFGRVLAKASREMLAGLKAHLEEHSP